jgi:hypothetical protein
MSTTDRDREPQQPEQAGSWPAEAGRQEHGGEMPQERTRGPEGVGTPQPGGPTVEETAEQSRQQPGGPAQQGAPESGRTP